MKTIKHILSLAILLPFMASGQTIVNGNFESWTATPYDMLAGWTNSNVQSIPQIGKPSYFKSTDAHSGSYALELQTVTNGVDTVGAYTLDAPNPGGKGNFTGGTPYSSQPTKITGYYKYSSPGKDSAGMLVIFKKAGVIISQDMFTLAPVSGYTAFSHNLSLNSTPDSMIIGIVSSYRIINNNNYSTGEIPGSTLYMDDLVFTGTGTMAPIPGGDFENGWTTVNIESPVGWQGDGDPGTIYQTTDSYKGMYAVKLEETSDGGETDLTNGNPTHNGSPTGGVAYSATKDTLIGYYKFAPIGGDSARVNINFSKNGSNIYSAYANLTAAGSYTMFSIPYSLFSVPDTMEIDFGTRGPGGNGRGTGHAGTTLIVDEIQLKSQPLHTGIELFHPNHAILSAYPNPASGLININPIPTTNGQGSLEIYNSLGQALIFKNLSEIANGNGIELNTESLKPGMYFYNVTNNGFSGSGTFIKK